MTEVCCGERVEVNVSQHGEGEPGNLFPSHYWCSESSSCPPIGPVLVGAIPTLSDSPTRTFHVKDI